MTLRIDWATPAAAEFACMHWHYSKCMPAFASVRVGAWEQDRFIGVVMFSRGANLHIGEPYGLGQHEAVELTRIALTEHQVPVSRILSITMRFLRQHCPGLRLLVSYADQAQGHHGGIYQATGWIYVGTATPQASLHVHGSLHHKRTLRERFGRGGNSIGWLREHVDPQAAWIEDKPKHKYLMPLDAAMRKQVLPLSCPYPKKDAEGYAPGLHQGQEANGGAA